MFASSALLAPFITFFGGVAILFMTVVFASVSEYKKQRIELLRASLALFTEGAFILGTIVRETRAREFERLIPASFERESKDERTSMFRALLENGTRQFFMSRMNLLSMGQTGIAQDIQIAYLAIFDHMDTSKLTVDLPTLEKWFEKANDEVIEKRSEILQSFERQLREESDFLLAAKRYFGWNIKPCATCGR